MRLVNPAKSIRDFYKLGTAFLKATGGERSPGAAEALANEHNCSQVTLYKARQFAEMYSREEVEELCSLRKPNDQPLGIGHIHQLIQVESLGDRKRLQTAAAKNGWSSRRLRDERKKKIGYEVATNIGRKPRRAANPEDALLQLAVHATQWLRWDDELKASSAGDDHPIQFTLGNLPPSVRGKLKAVTNAMHELAATLERLNVRKRNSG